MSVGVMITKFKLTNFAAIMILLAADLGIGYFTLPYIFSSGNFWCKKCYEVTSLASVLLVFNCASGLFSCYLFI
jgi:hypothetical protein